MSLEDAIVILRDKNRGAAVENTLKENTKDFDNNVRGGIEMPYNPKYLQVRQAFEKMNKDYWDKLVEKAVEETEALQGEERVRAINKIFLEYEKHKAAFYTYKSIVESPFEIDEKLSKLRKELAAIDKQIGEQFQGVQQSIF